MRMQYAPLTNKPRTLRSLTGFNPSEFERLLPSFSAAWECFVSETFEREGRKRAYGGGRKAHLSGIEDKLLFILVYFRIYPTQEVQGYLFGMSQAQANEWVHRLTGVLNAALGKEQQLPERQPANLERVLSQCPSLELIIDGIERPINRPKDKDKQKDYYSGKQKTHSVKKASSVSGAAK
jgi:hypothetical protein